MKAIKKANEIDYNILLAHFHKQIKELEDDLKFNVHLHMDPHKR